ncbi:MAG: T9SS type A sorting domain-containing protein [candidate division Zixibacteria bacterium]|nr:T9SS type A sorting domain-containing protein [candidate division Zixibacteria bacterium]
MNKGWRIYFSIVVGLVFFSGTSARAQFNCVEGVDWPTTYLPDTAAIISFQGLPGDTVEMPIFWKSDTAMVALEMNVRYPGNFIQPIVIRDTVITRIITTTVVPPDTTFDTTFLDLLDIFEVDRAVFTEVVLDSFGFPIGLDTLPFVSGEFSFKVNDSNLLKVQWVPGIPDIGIPLDSIPGGRGEIARVRFIVQPGAGPIGTSLALTIEHVPIIRTDTFPPVKKGCALTSSTQIWSVNFDGVIDVLTLLQVPVLRGGFFKVDTQIVEIECNASSECTTPPVNFTLPGFCVGGNCEYTKKVDECVDDTQCDSPPVGFQLPGTCINGSCQYTPITSTHAPIVDQVTPSAITVKQGDPIQFTVRATDDSANHIITLAATSTLPSGASFPVAVGNSFVTGTFNWTPSLTQAGTFVVSFRATDDKGNTSNTVSVTITVEELDIDQLFSTSSEGQRPAGGIAGFNPVLFPIDLINSKNQVYGVQFDFLYPRSQVEFDSVITTDRTDGFVIDWLENFNGIDSLVRIVTFGLANEQIVPGSTSAILNVVFHIDTAAVPGTYDVILSNGRESIDPNPAIPSVQLLTLPGVIDVDRLGDVNLDRFIDVADLVNVVAFIIGNYGLPPRNFATADVTNNDTVDVVDLVGISNIIFGITLSPQPAPAQGAPIATVDFGSDPVAESYNQLAILGDFPEEVAGVELHVNYDPSSVSLLEPTLTDVSRRFRLHYRNDGKGKMRVVIYNGSPWNTEFLIPNGVSEFLTINALTSENLEENDLYISDITLSNPDAGKIEVEQPEGPPVALPKTFYLAQNYPNPFNPETQIDFGIAADSDGATPQRVRLLIYNILGQKVITLKDEFLVPGEYSVKWSGNNTNGEKVATGVYLYRLEVGESRSETKKMILLK